MVKKCFQCQYFHRYYSKTYCGFYMEKFGECYKHNKVCDNKDGCEDFIFKKRNLAVKRAHVINALSNAITDINTIKLILEERELK